ncbi:Jerky protein, partial [Stegodyphus mimosarum]
MSERVSNSGAAKGSTKRKHVSMSIKQKVELLQKMDKGVSVSKLCKEYGIGKSTVYDIKKKKKELFEFLVDSNTPLAMNNRKIFRYAKSDDHDKVMIEWVRQRRSEGVSLTGPMLMAQAKIFHEEMNLKTECTYSTGWLTKFKNRHGITQLKISGENTLTDTEATELFADEFIELITSEELSPEQIYNADETGLFWQYVPRNTLATSAEKAPTGVKDSKARLTILACANAAGTHKCKLFVIGKHTRPQAFKGVTILPVIYRANKRAWMTRALMKDWFENHFIPEARQHLTSIGLPGDSKIVLIVDNCLAHTSLQVLAKDNVSVLFFPPNCTSIIQPMDNGIVHTLKCKYKVAFLKSMLNFLNNGKTIQEFLKYFSIKSAVWNIARSWEDVSPDTLKSAWQDLWPATIFHGEDVEDDSSEFEDFQISQTKGEIVQLMDFAEKCGEAVINEDDITEVFHCDDNVPVISQLTDSEICNMVLDPENTATDSEESDREVTENTTTDSEESNREVTENKKISIDKLVGILDTAIAGLEQWNFVTEQEIMSISRIKEKVLAQKTKQIKQLTLKEMFNKVNK